MLDYDVSMHNIVVLVVVIPTSPSSSKTESDCKSYCVFGVGHFIDRPGQPLGRPGWENGRGSSVGGPAIMAGLLAGLCNALASHLASLAGLVLFAFNGQNFTLPI